MDKSTLLKEQYTRETGNIYDSPSDDPIDHQIQNVEYIKWLENKVLDWRPVEELPKHQSIRILIKFQEQCLLGGNHICSGRWHHLVKHVQADHDDYLSFTATHFIQLNPN